MDGFCGSCTACSVKRAGGRGIILITALRLRKAAQYTHLVTFCHQVLLLATYIEASTYDIQMRIGNTRLGELMMYAETMEIAVLNWIKGCCMCSHLADGTCLT